MRQVKLYAKGKAAKVFMLPYPDHDPSAVATLPSRCARSPHDCPRSLLVNCGL